ncbi:MAG: STAS domain-containing protein [Pseudomonadota bacterium]
MSFSVEEREEAGRTVFAPNGRLDTVTAKEFETSLFDRIDSGAKDVLIDFNQIDYISSYGLRVMLKAAKQLSGDDKSFGIFGLSDTIKNVFVVSGFGKIIAISDTLDEALGVG